MQLRDYLYTVEFSFNPWINSPLPLWMPGEIAQLFSLTADIKTHPKPDLAQENFLATFAMTENQLATTLHI
jgi:hypothetical protein